MQYGKRRWAFFLLSVFGILLLHQIIPHTNHQIRIDFHHHDEGHGWHHDDPDDFQSIPLENHAETYPSEYLSHSRLELRKKSHDVRSDLWFHIESEPLYVQTGVHPVYPWLVLFDDTDLSRCTFKLRGPPQFV